MRFDGKVALVAGSSRNLGKAIAYGFGKEGGSVIINARESVDELEATAKEFRAEGIKVLPVQADVTDQNAVIRMVSQGIETFGKIDNLIISARILSPSRPFLETTKEEWLSSFGRVHATFYLLQAVIPGMLERKNGHIISVGGNLGVPGAGLLQAARRSFSGGGGSSGLLRYIMREFGPYIRVNSVSPGIMDTTRKAENYPNDVGGLPQNNPVRMKQIPLGRPGKPEELAAVVLFLLSDEASYINGANFEVNGGWGM